MDVRVEHLADSDPVCFIAPCATAWWSASTWTTALDPSRMRQHLISAAQGRGNAGTAQSSLVLAE